MCGLVGNANRRTTTHTKIINNKGIIIIHVYGPDVLLIMIADLLPPMSDSW
jgi:hypothetical protein